MTDMNNNNIQKIPEKAVPARQTQTGPGTPAARPGKAAPALPQQKPSGKAVPALPQQKPSGKIGVRRGIRQHPRPGYLPGGPPATGPEEKERQNHP